MNPDNQESQQDAAIAPTPPKVTAAPEIVSGGDKKSINLATGDTMPDPLDVEFSNLDQATATLLPSSDAATTLAASQPTPPSASKGSSRTGIVLGVIAAVVLLAGLAGGAWYYYENYALKSDYTKAIDVYNSEIKSATGDAQLANGAVDSVTEMSDEEIAKELARLKDMQVRIEKGLHQLGEQRVMKDEDVKQAYEEYNTQVKEVFPVVIAIYEAAPGLQSARAACAAMDFTTHKDRLSAAKTGDEARSILVEVMKPCTDQLELLKKSKSTIVADYATQFLGVFSDLADTLKSMMDATTAQEYSVSVEALKKINQEPSLINDEIQGRMDRLSERTKGLNSTFEALENTLHDKHKKALI